MRNGKKSNINKRGKLDNNKLIMSILVIACYFLWPQIIGLIKPMFDIGKSGAFIFDIVSNLLLMTILIFIYREDFKIYSKKFIQNLKKNVLTMLICTIITVVGVIAINGIVLYVFHIDQVTANDQSLFDSFKSFPLLISFMTIIFYPIIEEIVFEKTLKDIISNKWLFIILSSLFFWYYNIAYTGTFTAVTLLSSFYYFASAFIRSLAFYKTDNLFVPIGIKALYNAFVTFVTK